jgi:cell shape-determining protein MreD
MSYPILIGIGLLLLLLDGGLGSLISIAGIRPSLTLPFIVYVGLLRGPIEGTLFSASIGLALDIFSGIPTGLTMFSYTVAGFTCGKLWNGGPFRLIWPWGIYVVLCALGVEAVTHFILSRGMEIEFLPVFIRNGVPAALYTTGFGLLWFLSPLHRMKSA